ncbi:MULTISPECIES: polysaccharide deacetylase family sporulation protein PdaB [unclassified Mesobacillus]|jgi:peptidoglycan-N-acetylglucosamine deacetylase|uniref:polysaccharide deacetylase family sporulation protein PdaB n=1 Tax=unclassified Mesobacillus TaxID=2675270 RepID=UPI00203C2910|nr:MULTISPECIES: polysaccharide deacetylase family sporulation protein PdaB [unclassified Mesobacillus]MCM3125791.1 polysaccharide deacetylase family sporulation protein PdaB [Mesobacillus sp. MER 33]MCM3235812.1 polysaccharide deacetylase family sporulation protein PdaB [Mesobacillus sp. MER 48]
MNFFYVMNARSIKTAFVIIVAAFFTAWFFYMDNMVQIPAFSAKDGPKAIYKGEKDLALTFNIGWGDEKAEPILDVLAKQKAGAVTFFLSGSWAERHPDLVSRMVKEGYEIGMLGYDYKDYTELEEDKIRRDIMKAQEAFKKLNVKNIELLRAPTGHFDQRTLKIAERLGYTVVHWSLDTKDWTNPGTAVIAENASKAKKGDILLMHASDSAKQTAEALPLVLKDIKSKNLKMVTVSEMIANGDSKSAEVK